MHPCYTSRRDAPVLHQQGERRADSSEQEGKRADSSEHSEKRAESNSAEHSEKRAESNGSGQGEEGGETAITVNRHLSDHHGEEQKRHKVLFQAALGRGMVRSNTFNDILLEVRFYTFRHFCSKPH